jgi:hypothetical protein
MTYDELGALCGCGALEAREQAIHLSLDRRKSRDGTTRVKLDPPLTAKFIVSIRDADVDLDCAIDALRDTHRQMAEFLAPAELHRRRGVA